MKQLDLASNKGLQIVYKMGYGKIANLSVEEARRIFSTTLNVAPPNQTISIKHNGKSLPLHIYFSENKKPKSIIIYFHGGGYVIRQFSQSARICRQFADEMHACVILIEYSLSPESKFPTAIKEAAFAVDWVLHNKKLLHAKNNTPIYLYGESSGANLATAALLYQQNLNIQGNIIACPSLDYCHEYESKNKLYSNGFLLDENTRAWFANHYLNDESERNNPLVTFVLSKRLQLLPGTLIISAYFDPLRDEAHEFYRLLNQNNVPAKHIEFDTIHGFLSLKIKPYFIQAIDEIKKWILY